MALVDATAAPPKSVYSFCDGEGRSCYYTADDKNNR